MEEPIVHEKDKKQRKRKKLLFSQIREQMEFYFSDANLSKDRFLKKEIDQTDDGYVSLSLFSKFHKISELTKDVAVIAKAMVKSEMLKISEDKTKIKRVTPIIERTDVDERTVYVEHLPRGTDHEWIKKTFTEYGKVMYVSLPKYHTTGDIKGFAFVEFETEAEAQKACQALKQNNTSSGQEKIGQFPKSSKQLKHIQKQLQKQNIAESTGNIEAENDKAKNIKTDTCSENQSLSDQPGSTSNNETDGAGTPKICTKNRKRKLSDSHEESGDGSAKSKMADKKQKQDVDTGPANASTEELKSSVNQPTTSNENAKQVSSLRKRKADESDDSSSNTETKRVRISDDVQVQNVQEKKKKRRKKRQKPKIERDLPPLKVIPKKEWLRLKKEYLRVQKENMMSLKKTLEQHKQVKEIASHKHRPRSEAVPASVTKTEASQPHRRDIEYSPGVIVRFISTLPVVRKELLTFLPDTSAVAYVDLLAGGHTEGHIRCHTSDGADQLAKTDVKGVTFTILKDESEQQYWDKLKLDHEAKLSNKNKKKKKGMQKIVEKGEMLAATLCRKQHIVFDD